MSPEIAEFVPSPPLPVKMPVNVVPVRKPGKRWRRGCRPDRVSLAERGGLVPIAVKLAAGVHQHVLLKLAGHEAVRDNLSAKSSAYSGVCSARVIDRRRVAISGL